MKEYIRDVNLKILDFIGIDYEDLRISSVEIKIDPNEMPKAKVTHIILDDDLKENISINECFKMIKDGE